MKFAVGDRVKIREDAEIAEDFGKLVGTVTALVSSMDYWVDFGTLELGVYESEVEAA